MPLRVVVASREGGLGKTTLSLGVCALTALQGGSAGYLGIGYAPSVLTALNSGDLRDVPGTSNTVVRMYAGRHPGAEWLVAETTVPIGGSPAELANLFKRTTEDLFPRAEFWCLDWGLPLEYLAEGILERIDQMWLLSLHGRDEPQPPLTLALEQFHGRLDVRIVRGTGADLPSGEEGSPGHAKTSWLVMHPDHGPIEGDSPAVLVSPFSRNALSIAGFLQERT